MGRIGIFGGSFNPPHIGHLLAAEEAVRALELDQLYLIPAAAPPHKQLPPDSPDQAQRLALLRLAIAGKPKLAVSDLELRREGPSYSADTMRQLAAMHPNDTLYLLMGTDMFLGLHTWYQPQKLAELCTVAVLLRADLADSQEKELAAQEQLLRAQFGMNVIRLENRHVALSSTQVRRMLSFDAAQSYLPEPVLKEIYANRCYGVGANRKNLPMELLREQATALLDPGRVAHVLGCEQAAVELARRWGADETDAARAGLLHDVTKALTGPQQLILCDRYGIITSDFERENPKLLHAKTGAAIARHVFGENDAVCSAICWHTTGRAGMSVLEKILYLADYMEPNRNFDGVELLRAQVRTDLDLALCTALDMSMQALVSGKRRIDRNSREAWEYMNEKFAKQNGSTEQ